MYLDKPISYDKLLSNLEDINEEYEEIELLDYITQELEQYNFNKSRIGYMYLKDSIFMAIKSKNTLKDMQNDLFKKVSRKYKNTDANKIKWSIDKLISSSHNKKDAYITSKTFIMDIIESVNYKINNNSLEEKDSN